MFGHGHDFLHRQYAVYDIQCIERLFCTPYTIGFLSRTGRFDLGRGITHIGVFQFPGVRCFAKVQNETGGGDGMAL